MKLSDRVTPELLRIKGELEQLQKLRIKVGIQGDAVYPNQPRELRQEPQGLPGPVLYQVQKWVSAGGDRQEAPQAEKEGRGRPIR